MRFVGIDPSTKTGFVALDEQGGVLIEKELTGAGTKDPKRIGTLVDTIIRHIDRTDIICIEGFSYGSQGKGVSFQYGLGYMIRDRLFRAKIAYTDVPPTAVKKFATGKGNTKKDAMAVPIYRKWGFEHQSDNVRDAFVLAKIAEELHMAKDFGESTLTCRYEVEVIEVILNPPHKRKKVTG